MVQIIEMLKYNIYYDYTTDTAYINSVVKVRHLKQIREWLLEEGYKFKNIVIGRPDV